jgi:hypothetical protein
LILYKKGNNGSEQEQKKEQDDKKNITRKITGIRCERSDNNIGSQGARIVLSACTTSGTPE